MAARSWAEMSLDWTPEERLVRSRTKSKPGRFFNRDVSRSLLHETLQIRKLQMCNLIINWENSII